MIADVLMEDDDEWWWWEERDRGERESLVGI